MAKEDAVPFNTSEHSNVSKAKRNNPDLVYVMSKKKRKQLNAQKKGV